MGAMRTLREGGKEGGAPPGSPRPDQLRDFHPGGDPECSRKREGPGTHGRGAAALVPEGEELIQEHPETPHVGLAREDVVREGLRRVPGGRALGGWDRPKEGALGAASGKEGDQGTLEQGEPLGDRAWERREPGALQRGWVSGDRAWEHEEHQDPWGVLGGIGPGSTGSTEIMGVMDWVKMGMGWGAEVLSPTPPRPPNPGVHMEQGRRRAEQVPQDPGLVWRGAGVCSGRSEWKRVGGAR